MRIVAVVVSLQSVGSSHSPNTASLRGKCPRRPWPKKRSLCTYWCGTTSIWSWTWSCRRMRYVRGGSVDSSRWLVGGLFLGAFVMWHCIALMLPCVFGSAAGCGAPGSEGAHPAGAGGVSGPPGVRPGAAETRCRPHTQQRTGLDQWVLGPGLLTFQWLHPVPLNVDACVFQSCRRRWAPGTLSCVSWCCSTETSRGPRRDWRASLSCSANSDRWNSLRTETSLLFTCCTERNSPSSASAQSFVEMVSPVAVHWMFPVCTHNTASFCNTRQHRRSFLLSQCKRFPLVSSRHRTSTWRWSGSSPVGVSVVSFACSQTGHFQHHSGWTAPSVVAQQTVYISQVERQGSSFQCVTTD